MKKTFKDIQSPTLLYLKGALFLVLGVISALLLLAEIPTLKAVLFLALAIWSFCRAYYFAFYVIEHYIDPTYRFSGIGSFVAHLYRIRFVKPRGSGSKNRQSSTKDRQP